MLFLVHSNVTLIEKLDAKGSPVLIMDVFMDFGKFIQNLSYTDKEVTLEFLQKLRDEKKFSSVEDLIEQLENDKKTCIAIIENYRDV